MTNDTYQKLLVRLPKDVKAWLKEQASMHSSSETSEIIRAVRERMERVQQRTAA